LVIPGFAGGLQIEEDKMKKTGFVFFLAVLAFTGLFSQDIINDKVRQAIDGLAVRINRPIEVTIAPITIEGSDTPTALSRFLAGKINLFASNHTKYKVILPVRGVGRRQQNDSQAGKITGTYQVLGETVDVTLTLVSESSGQILGSSNFTVPAPDLKNLGLDLLPQNAATVQEVKQREEIFTPLQTTDAANSSAPFAIEAWPNSHTRTYYSGDLMTITVWSDRDCYIKVFHINVDNEKVMIYPNSQGDRDNFLPGNAEIIIPRQSEFKIEPPYGRETILVEASVRQFEELESEMARVSRGLAVIKKEIDDEVKKTAGAIVTTRFDFTILPPGVGE
jgi:hypothetical protein